MKKSFLAGMACFFGLSLLSGCAPILVGSAAVGTTAVVLDRRTAGDVTNDKVIESKAAIHLTQTAFTSSHITSTSYEGDVLLSGEVGTEDDKEKATEIVSSINGVKRVINELGVMPNSSLTTRMNDTVVAGKVRAALIDTKGISLNSLKVVVDRGTCYLLGAVTEKEASIIIDVARRVKGVEKVVNLMKIISEAELQKRQLVSQNNDTISNETQTEESANEEVTVSPIK